MMIKSEENALDFKQQAKDSVTVVAPERVTNENTNTDIR